jgi:hypothetical protein
MWQLERRFGQNRTERCEFSFVLSAPYCSKCGCTDIGTKGYECTRIMLCVLLYAYISVRKGKAVPLQAWTGPERSRKLRFPDFVTTAQDSGSFSALSTGRFYPQEILLVLISVRG